MNETRIVTPEEAQEVTEYANGMTLRLAHTVATEPERIRAAVVKALRWSCENGHYATAVRADAIENGSDW